MDPDNQTTLDQAEIVEGEIIEPAVSSDSNPQVDTELDWVGMINGHLSQIENLKEQLKKFRDMLQSIYENDPTYQEHDKAVKEASKIRNQTKKQLNKLPQVADLNNKITDIRQMIKEHTNDLSDYVQQYAKSSGATTIETQDGTLREIIYVAKLVKK